VVKRLEIQRRFKFVSHTPSQLSRLAEQWEDGFDALQKFHQREGHCRVLRGNQEFGFNLCSWVNKQRSRKEGLTPDRIKRLDSLGFTWGLRADRWEKSFAALQKFYQREGHCRVPEWSQEFGLNLGSWVQMQRYSEEGLTPDQLKRLNALGFVWKA